jgi:hypothetical protein
MRAGAPQIYQKDPRRLGAGPTGDAVWVGESYAGNRFADVDNSTDPPTLWLPYYRVNQPARIQFQAAPVFQ